MRLPASGKARFGLGFWPIVGFFLLANLATAIPDKGEFDEAWMRIRYGLNEVGFPYPYWRVQSFTGYTILDEYALAIDIALYLFPATALGFVLFKFGDPNRRHDYLCKGCGYDLRGIEPDVCPECGVAVNQDDELADP